MMPKKSFNCGQIMATPGVIEAMRYDSGPTMFELLARHLNCDWGDVCNEDKASNDAALETGARLLSAYHLKNGVKIWIITEAVGDNGKRPYTTLLLPKEY